MKRTPRQLEAAVARQRALARMNPPKVYEPVGKFVLRTR